MAYVLAKDPGSRRIQIVTVNKERHSKTVRRAAEKSPSSGRFAPVDLIVERCMKAPQMVAA